MAFMLKHTLAVLASALSLTAFPVQAQNAELAGAPDRIVPDNQHQVRLSYAPIVSEAAPAVVNVYSTRTVRQRVSFFSNRTAEREQNSLGSGVIVEPSGIVVTNHHVVANSDALRVVLADRREFEAEILLTDEATDLAVLRIEADEPLPVLPFDMTADNEVGDLVLAIGNPFGVGQTVTSGIVSALARTDVGRADFGSFIQTDAAINPGNSGGALVNMEGELIGVNTMIFSRSGGSNGIGFAIPVEMVRRVVDSAMSEGELIRPWLGARLQPVTGDLADVFGLDRPRGAVVNEIYPGAAADDAGLLRGDIVLAVDGRDVNDESGARFHLATRANGEDARFTILREGETLDVDVPVLPAPGIREPDRVRLEGAHPLDGIILVELSPAFNETVGVDPFADGLAVFRVGRRTQANYAGFRPGDILIEVMGEPVETVEDVQDVLARFEGERRWPVVIERRGERQEATLNLRRR